MVPNNNYNEGGFLAMALKNQYLIDLLETVKKRNAGEPENKIILWREIQP